MNKEGVTQGKTKVGSFVARCRWALATSSSTDMRICLIVSRSRIVTVPSVRLYVYGGEGMECASEKTEFIWWMNKNGLKKLSKKRRLH